MLIPVLLLPNCMKITSQKLHFKVLKTFLDKNMSFHNNNFHACILKDSDIFDKVNIFYIIMIIHAKSTQIFTIIKYQEKILNLYVYQ